MINQNTFKAKVSKRANQIVQDVLKKSVERTALLQARGILKDMGVPIPRHLDHPPVNGKVRMKRVHTRINGDQPVVKSSAILVRGPVMPSDVTVRKGSILSEVSEFARSSLHSNGKFRSGRATRADMEAYLKASFPKVNPNSIQPSVSVMIKKGFLAVDKGT